MDHELVNWSILKEHAWAGDMKCRWSVTEIERLRAELNSLMLLQNDMWFPIGKVVCLACNSFLPIPENKLELGYRWICSKCGTVTTFDAYKGNCWHISTDKAK